jgi:hypothetical protein
MTFSFLGVRSRAFAVVSNLDAGKPRRVARYEGVETGDKPFGPQGVERIDSLLATHAGACAHLGDRPCRPADHEEIQDRLLIVRENEVLRFYRSRPGLSLAADVGATPYIF